MLNRQHLQGRIDGACAKPFPSQRTLNLDSERAPVIFGWWLYAQERFGGRCHLETLYRLDRVGTRLDGRGQLASLQPSAYYGQSTDKLRELLRVRQHTLLPRAPLGQRWIGPQLVQEWPCAALASPDGFAAPEGRDPVPQDPGARLDLARRLASRILRDRAAV
ncbi:hypothetical protein [Ramlibacter sp. AN1133]|uniref:hypothetical protein n=1 Tax=Ramlibacter sp. AN1133 TaxID=3133429 RepID=UPI0030BC0052